MDWGVSSFQFTKVSPREISPILIRGLAMRSWVFSLSTQPPASPLKYLPNKSSLDELQKEPDFRSGAMSPPAKAVDTRQQLANTDKKKEMNFMASGMLKGNSTQWNLFFNVCRNAPHAKQKGMKQMGAEPPDRNRFRNGLHPRRRPDIHCLPDSSI